MDGSLDCNAPPLSVKLSVPNALLWPNIKVPAVMVTP